jgi:hypothetical protein
MKVSIFSTIFATLLAATSAAPVDTSCQSQVDALRQFQIDTLFQPVAHVIFHGATPVAFFEQNFPTASIAYPISKFIFIFPFLSFFLLLHID